MLWITTDVCSRLLHHGFGETRIGRCIMITAIVDMMVLVTGGTRFAGSAALPLRKRLRGRGQGGKSYHWAFLNYPDAWSSQRIVVMMVLVIRGTRFAGSAASPCLKKIARRPHVKLVRDGVAMVTPLELARRI